MKGRKHLSSFAAGLSALALVAQGAPLTATAAQTGTPDLDLSIVRAAAAPVVSAPAVAPSSKGQLAGGGGAGDCIVKFFEPDKLKNSSYDTLVLVQAKLICTDIVGQADLVIEQNDQIVVAQSVTNNQSNVTFFSTTVELNKEQEETFCVAVFRAGELVAQQCWDDLAAAPGARMAMAPSAPRRAPLRWPPSNALA